jgi:hypothetical protein
MAMKPLRVLHVPDLVGGNAPALARAEREVGLSSTCIAFVESPFGYVADEVLRAPGVGRATFERRRLQLLWRALARADVVHFNFGRSILPRSLALRELPLLRAAGKAIVVTYQGDDARTADGSAIARLDPTYYTAEGDELKRRSIAAFDRYADRIFFLNPDLARYLPERARFMPYAHVDPREWQPRASGPRTPLHVAHAPSNRAAKGTRYILDAVETLRAEGIRFDFELIEGLSNADARRRYEHVDLFVDQLVVGWYGGVAVELMALTKPVIAHIEPHDLAVVPEGLIRDLPVIDATTESITAVLREVLTVRRDELPDIGETSRRFVEAHHDPRRIALHLKREYEDAVGGR